MSHSNSHKMRQQQRQLPQSSSTRKVSQLRAQPLFRGRDPVIDEIIQRMADKQVSVTYVSNKSGLARSTLYNWTKGHTKRPQHASVRFALRTIGYDLGIIKIS